MKPSKNVAPAYVSSGARVYRGWLQVLITAEAVEAQARAKTPALKRKEEDILWLKRYNQNYNECLDVYTSTRETTLSE